MKNEEKMKVPRMFTKADIVPSECQTIYLEREELIENPPTPQMLRLQQTTDGYGSKLKTCYKICFEGRQYVIYATCYSNAASLWFTAKGEQIWISY